MKRSVRVGAPAKINLSLYIKSRRPDGYHDIESVMQSIGMMDILDITIELSGDPNAVARLDLICDDPHIPCGKTNTVYRAAELFTAEVRKKNDPLYIQNTGISLTKVIPGEAGLGGGSSDAAAALIGLNHLCGNALGEKEMYSLAGKVGADVPFCMTGGTALCSGTGENITKLEYIGDLYVLIVKPDFGISTARAYEAMDEHLAPIPDNNNITDLYKGINEFETYARKNHLEIDSLLKELGSLGGSVKSGMSGSGSACYALFKKKGHAVEAYNLYKEKSKEASMFVELTNTIPYGVKIL